MNKPEHNFATILRGGYAIKIDYPAKLFIFDLSGRLRWHAVRQNKSIVKFPDLPTGLYIIELKRENKPVERMSVILLK